MSKKNLTSAASTAANKFFSGHQADEIAGKDHDKDTNVTNVSKDTNITNVTNKSKHYDDRGKREIRHGLLLDKQLKEDLVTLCCAAGNRSINDYIVSLLIDHTEQPANKKLLQEYRKLKTNG